MHVPAPLLWAGLTGSAWSLPFQLVTALVEARSAPASTAPASSPGTA